MSYPLSRVARKRERRPIEIEGPLAFVLLATGERVLIDTGDVALVAPHMWSASSKSAHVYAVTAIAGEDGVWRTASMHRLIMDAPRGLMVDHANRNGLDNRRSNLRLCTRSQNMANAISAQHSSRFRGVRWDTSAWRAQITVNRTSVCLGSFGTEEQAAAAYDAAALKEFGAFARLNLQQNPLVGT